MTTKTAKIGNRTYEISETETGPNLSALLLSRGFDGQAYVGMSRAVGRFREHCTMLYRTVSGEFVIALRA